MVCDMPGCRGESSATYSKCGVFHGVNIHHVVLHVCDALGLDSLSTCIAMEMGRPLCCFQALTALRQRARARRSWW